MKKRTTKGFSKINGKLPLASAMAALVVMPSAQATDLYWDVNGATSGFSTVVGAWNDTNLFWNTDSGGGAGTFSAVPASADDLFIRQATTNSGSITLSGATKNASSITFAANVGATTLTGGTINIGGTGVFDGIRQQSNVGNTINSALQLDSGNTAFNFSNSSSGLLTIGGAVTGTATSGNVTQMLTIGSSSGGGITIGGAIADVSGSATKVALTVNNTSTGVTTLTGTNTYTGTTTISHGSLNLQHATGLGSTAGGTSVANNAALQLQGGITVGAEALTLNGTGVSSTGALLNVSGNNTYGGAITRGGNTTIGSTAGTLTLSGPMGGNFATTFTGAGNITSSGVISSTANAGITKSGTGTLTLSAANTFTGPTTISDGKVALTNASALQFSAYNTAGSNGTTIGLDVSNPGALTSGSLTLGGLVGSVNLANAFTAGYGSVTNLTLAVQSGRDLTYSGVIADGASGMTITVGGGGFQRLSNNNTYTGDTVVNGSYLFISHNNALGTTAGKTVVNGTTGGRLVLNNNITVAEPITSYGDPIFHSALQSASGVNIISGPVTLTSDPALEVRLRVRVENGSQLTFTGGITSARPSLFVMNPIGTATLAITTTPIDLTSTGIFWHDSGTGVSALGVTGNTFGTTSVSTGTIRLDVANALPSITAVNIGHNFANGGTLDLNGNSQKIFGLQHTVPQNGVLSALVVTSATAATLTLDSSTPGGDPSRLPTQPYLYGGNITGALSIVKNGPNTATFAGANTYTGGTEINGGTLALGSAGALGSSGTIAFGGGTLQHSASNTTDYSSRFSNAASQQYSIDTNSQSVTLATALTSSGGSFTKLGAGTLSFSSSNTYSGASTVSAGTLELSGASGALTATNAVNINGGTLLLSGSAANRINNAAPVSLGAATNSILQLSGAVTETMGALTLSGAAARVIDFGSTSGLLTFASLAAGSTLPLQIWNWSGITGSGGGTDQITISSGSLGGSLALTDVTFYSDSGSTLYPGATGFTSNNELVPIPEASTLLGILGLMVPLAWRERRHWARCRTARA